MTVLEPTFFEPDDAAAPADVHAPMALVLPAMGVPAGVYRRLGLALAALGTPVAVVEWRGTGASPVQAGRGADWGYLDLLEHEVVRGLAAARAHWPGRPVVLLGHSLGGQIALMVRARAVPGVDGVLLVAAGTPHHRTFSPAIARKLRTVVRLHRVIAPLVGYYPGQRLGFGGRQPRQLMSEWAELAWTGRLQLAGADAFAPRTADAQRIPVRALVLDQDSFAPHAAATELLRCAGLGEGGIERWSGPGPCGHFDWLKEPQPIAARIGAVLTELVLERRDALPDPPR
jgi:predicted alpha/beta hydrolase